MENQEVDHSPSDDANNAQKHTDLFNSFVAQLRCKLRLIAERLIPLLKWLYHETLQITKETFSQTQRIASYINTYWHGNVLERRKCESQAAFGRKAYELGHGDGYLRSQITNLDERISSVVVAKGSIKTLQLEKKGLMMRLADSVLMQEISPSGLESEFATMKTMLVAIENHCDNLTKAKVNLWPLDFIGLSRIGIG